MSVSAEPVRSQPVGITSVRAASRLYANRRRRNGIAMVLSFAATMFGLGWLVLILGELLWEGLGGISLSVFTEMTPPPGADGGLLNPIMGSLMLTVLAVLIGTPVGILAGTYMAEYGRYSPLTSVVRTTTGMTITASATAPANPEKWPIGATMTS